MANFSNWHSKTPPTQKGKGKGTQVNLLCGTPENEEEQDDSQQEKVEVGEQWDCEYSEAPPEFSNFICIAAVGKFKVTIIKDWNNPTDNRWILDPGANVDS